MVSDLVRRYMSVVYGNEDINDLEDVLHENLIFNGPLFNCDSASAYIKALSDDPPKDFNYQLTNSFTAGDIVILEYNFTKKDIIVPMTQLFRIKNNKITEIELYFDPTPFIIGDQLSK